MIISAFRHYRHKRCSKSEASSKPLELLHCRTADVVLNAARRHLRRPRPEDVPDLFSPRGWFGTERVRHRGRPDHGSIAPARLPRFVTEGASFGSRVGGVIHPHVGPLKCHRLRNPVIYKRQQLGEDLLTRRPLSACDLCPMAALGEASPPSPCASHRSTRA